MNNTQLSKSEYFLAEFCNMQTNKIIDEELSAWLNNYMLLNNKQAAHDLWTVQVCSVDTYMGV